MRQVSLDFASYLTHKLNVSADSITYFCTEVGIMRSGCGVFPISVRNSPAAVAHLLTKMSVSHLLIGPEPQYQDLAASALRLMKGTGTSIPEASTMLVFTDIFKGEDEPWEPLPEVKLNWDDVALVQHSSGEYHIVSLNDLYLTSAYLGSTAFPKPIVMTHWRYLQWGFAPCQYCRTILTRLVLTVN